MCQINIVYIIQQRYCILQSMFCHFLTDSSINGSFNLFKTILLDGVCIIQRLIDLTHKVLDASVV